jgi:hypothetical protein
MEDERIKQIHQSKHEKEENNENNNRCYERIAPVKTAGDDQ